MTGVRYTWLPSIIDLVKRLININFLCFFFNFISKMNWIVALAYLTKETRFIQQFAFYACIRRTRLMDDSDASFLNVSQDISNLYID